MTDDQARALIQERVSRETFARLQSFEQLLLKWQKAINLIAPSTVSDIWQRHILDSAQIFFLQNRNQGNWLDVGSGAGFPGLICAIIAHDSAPFLQFTMVESDQRKASFLRVAVQQLGLTAEVISKRIEELPCQSCDILSARALAPLPKLLMIAEQHLSKEGSAFFLKGASYQKEIKEALESWVFTAESSPSETASDAVILKIEGIRRV